MQWWALMIFLWKWFCSKTTFLVCKTKVDSFVKLNKSLFPRLGLLQSFETFQSIVMPYTLPMEMLQMLGNNQSCCQTFYLYLMNCTKHLPNIFYIRQCCGCFVIPFQQKHGVFDNCVFYSSLHLFNKWVSDSYDSITQSNTLTNKTHHSSQ